MRISIIALILVSISFKLSAQQQKPGYNLTVLLGYGTENNWGNTAFYAGLAINKKIKRKWATEVGITYFTTDIYNENKDKPTSFEDEERRYNAIFLNMDVQYIVGNENSLINAKIKIGPALKYYDYKAFRSGLFEYYPATGREEPIRGTINYHEKRGVNISLYNGFSLDAKVNSGLRIGVFLDIYSNQILIEHFMPGINAIFKLGTKNK
ncbi:hypothetical protein [Pedobacter endophyticus]|uniref:Outer membrane protein beta-barrel domain-containing protein n=1 Tax=Pedobacter endophyticus TaxID=2789740 RepID=A0A7S9KYH4_9SPHI|nr:hypothetical protein [Pedobacter endophyticus]QPH39180.1 hypothetical protein IZT61_19325 [Pedobacter endophyticus]